MRSLMRCFGLIPSPPPPAPRPSPSPSPPSPLPSATSDHNDPNWWHQRSQTNGSHHSPISTTETNPSTASSSMNLTYEYALAFHTTSCNEIRSIIFNPAFATATSSFIIGGLLNPDRDTVAAALAAAPASPLHETALLYFESSELTSHLCLSLHRGVQRAGALYAPLSLLPHPDSQHLDFIVERLNEFLVHDNPFPGPAAFAAFRSMRDCFTDLRPQLDRPLRTARRRHLLLRRTTRGSAACLIASTLAVAAAGLALATHALAALVASPSILLSMPPDLLAGQRRRLRERIARLDGAARGAYVLNSDLGTIEPLVAGLHATVESDKELVRLGIERGRGKGHLIEEVLRHLRSSQPRFLRQLRDLDEHVCLCFAAVNRARSMLLRHIHHSAMQHSRSMKK